MENETIYRDQQKTKKHKQYTPLRDPKTTAKKQKKIHKYYK